LPRTPAVGSGRGRRTGSPTPATASTLPTPASAIWAWYGNRAPERAADADALLDQPPGFQQAARLAPDQLTRFGNTVRNVHDPDKQLEQVYHSALKLAKLAASARRRPHAEAPRPFGEEFEYAVLGRLLQWLDTSAPAQAVVQSVWRDVKATRGDGAQNVAQLDIAIALRNGILLSLECKSYDIDLKDIDARIAVLQRSASSLAAMAVCSPWLTGLRDRPWFPRMQKYALQMQAWPQIAHLPLTLAGQPAGYTDPDGNTHQVPAFEDALQRWLARYL
jgi:hypothetical protein